MPAETPRTCPVCTTRIPEGFPAGLCPKCLLTGTIPQLTVEGAPAPTPHGESQGSTLPLAGPAPGRTSRSSSVPSLETLRRLFPDLEILDVLGTGGMGAVFRARQPRLHRLVALKIMVPSPGLEEDFALRFEREAQVLARLNHPNIVILHDFGEIGEERTMGEPLYWFLMEHVNGTDLGVLIKSKELRSAQALAIVPQICDALQYAHDQGITHRDIKPANILIDKKGAVKIADFGLAKMASGTEASFMTGLTLTGTAMGTPHYMAPEIWNHPDQVDHRADIYALGVVIYEMLTGERPVGVFEPPSRKASGVDRKLDNVVSHAMEKDPARRYQQAVEVKDDVTRITSANLKRCKSIDGSKDASTTRGISPLLMSGIAAALAVGCWVLWQGSGRGKKDPEPGNTSGSPSTQLARPNAAPKVAEARMSAPTLMTGVLKAQGTSRGGRPIDLAKAQDFNDFKQVILHDHGWVALRANGQTVSNDGRGERSNIAKICPGGETCFALIDNQNHVELVGRSGTKADPNAALPADVNQIGAVDVSFDGHHGIALLKDGSARVWGNHYDNPKAVPEWLGQDPWERPPAGALSQVISIAFTPMSASTITADGKLWTWGKSSVAIPANAEALQGEYASVISAVSGLYDARTRDGRVVRFNLSLLEAQVSAPGSTEGVFGGYRPLHRRSDGSWYTSWSADALQPYLDLVRGSPSSRFSLMSFLEPDDKLSVGLIQIQSPGAGVAGD